MIGFFIREHADGTADGGGGVGATKLDLATSGGRETPPPLYAARLSLTLWLFTLYARLPHAISRMHPYLLLMISRMHPGTTARRCATSSSG